MLKARLVKSICKTWEKIQGPAAQSPNWLTLYLRPGNISKSPAVQSPISANPRLTLYVRPGNISRGRLFKSPICANPRLTL